MANAESRSRIIDSISPVNKDWGIWQARDNYIGASWIIALGYEQIYHLTSFRDDGSCWRIYRPSTASHIVEANSNGDYDVTAVVASFHDSKHDLAPPALLMVGKNFIYRNSSGHTVPLSYDLVCEILEMNHIRTLPQ